MKRLWVHEVLRVYGDRLVDEADSKWLVEQMRKTMSEYMNDDLDHLFEDLLDEPGMQLTEVQLRNLIYCDFHSPAADRKLYTEISDWDALAVAVEEYLAEYNEISNTPMDLVLFRCAFDQVERKIYRYSLTITRNCVIKIIIWISKIII